MGVFLASFWAYIRLGTFASEGQLSIQESDGTIYQQSKMA